MKTVVQIAAALMAAASLWEAGAAPAQSAYPQVKGPGGTYVPPTPVATTGIDAVSGQACVIASAATCVPAGSAALPSGAAPVTGTIASATSGAVFTPTPGRPFNITLSGTWTGSCQLERQLGGAWYPVTISAGGSVIQAEYWSVNASDQWVEGEAGVAYRIDCAAAATGGGWVSGTVSYRFDQ